MLANSVIVRNVYDALDVINKDIIEMNEGYVKEDWWNNEMRRLRDKQELLETILGLNEQKD